MLVLCDFDGTITLEDVTNALMDKFTGRGWRNTHQRRYQAGEIGHLDIMQLSYADLPVPEDELRAFYQTMPVRPHFDELVQLCQTQDWPLAVVSGGLQFYLRDFLPPGLPFYSYLGEYDPTGPRWLVRRPDTPTVGAGQDFKVRVLEELQSQHPQARPSVFIGDGFNDYKVATHCDYVYAVRGSRLAQMCAESGRSCTEFDDFAQVVASLQAVGKEVKHGKA